MYLDLGWYSGESWLVLELRFMEFVDKNFFILFNIGVAKFRFGLSWDIRKTKRERQ
jgi:hypothetical protein